MAMNPHDTAHAHLGAIQNAARPFYRLFFFGFRIPKRSEAILIKKLGFDGVIVGFTDEDSPNAQGVDLRPGRPDRSDLDDIFRWRSRKGPQKLKACLDLCEELDLLFIPMTWARLTKAYNETLAEAFEPFWRQINHLLLNTERFFQKVVPPGMTREEAVKTNLLPYLQGRGVQLGMTGYTYATPADLDLLPYVYFVIPQMYSRGDWARAKGKDGRIYIAGRTQEVGQDRWDDKMRDDQLLIGGLACYAQKDSPGGALGYPRSKNERTRMGGLRAQAKEVMDFDGYAWWSYMAKSTKNGTSGNNVLKVLGEINGWTPEGNWRHQRNGR